MTDSRSILVIDNYDSFTFNLVHYLMEMGARVEVVRNDAISADEAMDGGHAGYLISPGPCTPNEAGISLDIGAACAAACKPLLGVCLGEEGDGATRAPSAARAADAVDVRSGRLREVIIYHE